MHRGGGGGGGGGDKGGRLWRIGRGGGGGGGGDADASRLRFILKVLLEMQALRMQD